MRQENPLKVSHGVPEWSQAQPGLTIKATRVFQVQKDTLFCRSEANSGSQVVALDQARQGHLAGILETVLGLIQIWGDTVPLFYQFTFPRGMRYILIGPPLSRSSPTALSPSRVRWTTYNVWRNGVTQEPSAGLG